MAGEHMNNVQEKILKVYKNMLFICEENNIPFYAAGGTAIGAVRHHGFIPWDDDLDLFVPIEYLEKLRKVLENSLPAQYLIYNAKCVVHTSSVWDKVHDSFTTNIEFIERELPDAYHGIWIDIIPIMSLPNNCFLRILYVLKVRMYKVLNYCLRYSDVNVEMEGRFILLKRALKKILKNLPLDKNFFYNRIFKLFKKYPFDNDKNDRYFLSPSNMLVTKKEYFKEVIWFDFEDTRIPLPNGYDGYLTDWFDDYLQLPPETERVSPHRSFVDLEKSYSNYKNNVKIVIDFFS